jgi:hypothetical protein
MTTAEAFDEAILSRAGASLSDIVSVRRWIINAEDIKAYAAIAAVPAGKAHQDQ